MLPRTSAPRVTNRSSRWLRLTTVPSGHLSGDGCPQNGDGTLQERRGSRYGTFPEGAGSCPPTIPAVIPWPVPPPRPPWTSSALSLRRPLRGTPALTSSFPFQNFSPIIYSIQMPPTPKFPGRPSHALSSSATHTLSCFWLSVVVEKGITLVTAIPKYCSCCLLLWVTAHQWLYPPHPCKLLFYSPPTIRYDSCLV